MSFSSINGQGLRTATSWLTKVGGQEVAIFQQTSDNFRQGKLWVLRISILPLNSPMWGIFSPKFWIFGRKYSDRLKFRRGGGNPPPLPTLPRRHCEYYLRRNWSGSGQSFLVWFKVFTWWYRQETPLPNCADIECQWKIEYRPQDVAHSSHIYSHTSTTVCI